MCGMKSIKIKKHTDRYLISFHVMYFELDHGPGVLNTSIAAAAAAAAGPPVTSMPVLTKPTLYKINCKCAKISIRATSVWLYDFLTLTGFSQGDPTLNI